MIQPAKQDLLEALSSVGAAHAFSIAGTRPTVLPGLRVEGAGEIGLPVRPADARALIAAADPAPFGRGEETVIDPAVVVAPDYTAQVSAASAALARLFEDEGFACLVVQQACFRRRKRARVNPFELVGVNRRTA